MLYFLTYGDDKYANSKKRIEDEAKSLNIFDKIFIKGPNDLPIDLPEMTKKVLTLARGGGYWIWKPIIVKSVLDILNNGDILLYADSGCHLNKYGINRLLEYFKYITNENKPLIRFQMRASEYKYTSSAILKYFNVENNKDVTHSGQYMATSFIICKNDISMKIINEWYNVAIEKPLLFTDFYNNIDRHCDFQDNRHDQSIFSIITKKYIENIWNLNDETNPYDINYPICATRIRG